MTDGIRKRILSWLVKPRQKVKAEDHAEGKVGGATAAGTFTGWEDVEALGVGRAPKESNPGGIFLMHT